MTDALKYPRGKVMPENVLRALRIAGKVGFITRGLWNEFCATGKTRWNQKQLQFLVAQGLLILHPNPTASDCWVLSKAGRRFLEDRNYVRVRPAPVSQLHHDESLARWLLVLSRDRFVAGWKGEMELKRAQAKEFQLTRDLKNQKYPDAIFRIHAIGRERCFALEYERTQKASLKYKDILWAYARMESVSVVVFVCENLAIENAIQGRLKHLALPVLWNRVALSQAADWQRDPADAPIRLDGKAFTLRELTQPRTRGDQTLMAANVAA